MRNEPVFRTKEEEDAYWKKYDEEIQAIVERCPKNVRKAFNFLYASDTEGSVSYGTCKHILNAIGDYDDTVRYGYAGRTDCAMFRDFKEILMDCAENKRRMKWK